MALQFANIPWQIKALYGIVSDSFPIAGRARSPYIVLSSLLGVLSFAVLAMVRPTNFALPPPNLENSPVKSEETNFLAPNLQICKNNVRC